jgi:hypothetical protein
VQAHEKHGNPAAEAVDGLRHLLVRDARRGVLGVDRLIVTDGPQSKEVSPDSVATVQFSAARHPRHPLLDLELKADLGLLRVHQKI